MLQKMRTVLVFRCDGRNDRECLDEVDKAENDFSVSKLFRQTGAEAFT